MTDENGNTEGSLLTTAEVAKHLRISEGTVSQWVKLGKLPVVKVGSLNRFRRADIDAWVAKNWKPAEGGDGETEPVEEVA